MNKTFTPIFKLITLTTFIIASTIVVAKKIEVTDRASTPQVSTSEVSTPKVTKIESKTNRHLSATDRLIPATLTTKIEPKTNRHLSATDRLITATLAAKIEPKTNRHFR